jgi:PAS domain S-box-containing protein
VESLRQLFGPSGYMPHGYCYLWNARLVWLHVVSDGFIALSYFAIPVILLWIVRKRRDLPFSWMFVLFGLFIVACGSTHVMEIWNLWHGDYWLAGFFKAITAAASICTAILLASLVPRALALPNISQWADANAQLEAQMRERRDVELDLRISEASYRELAELLELTQDAIFVRSLEGKILYWNRGAEKLYGWRKDEVQGKVAHELLRTVFPKPWSEMHADVVLNGSWEGELMHYRRDGGALIVSTRWVLRKDGAGRPAAILASNRDVTLRKREEDKFRNLLESAPDAMVIVDGAGDIQLVNAQTEKLFGYSRQEMIGRPVELLIPKRYHDRHAGHRDAYSQIPRPRSMGAGLELHGVRKDGAEFLVEISLSPLQTEAGILISSAIRDVTEQRAAQEELERQRAALARSNAELTAANKELEAFSYTVSHDLRAPLRHIDGFARILKDEHAESLSDQAVRYLDRILQAANHMGHLVDDLLNLAHISRKEIVGQKVDIDDLARQAIEEVPQEAESRDIEWRIEPLPELECDPGLLKLVLINLLSNAVKFTRGCQPAVIEVGTRQIEGATAIYVRDNGVGFDQKYADKLFGVFQRLHRQEDFEGTGIGLATVQRIIHRHGGAIWAEAELGRGATFFFTLGVCPASVRAAGSKEAYLGRV